MKPWLLAIVMVVLLTTVNCSLLSDTVDEPAFYTGLEVLTGHQDTIETIRVDDRRDLLFSGSRDGTIKVWKVGSSMLLRSLLVSHLPAGRFAVHPTLPHIAALEVLGPSSSRLTVWNWERGIKLYTIALPDDPLYFAYSPRGTYLVMCRADWESLSLYRARDGRRLSMLDDGFGIVSYFTVSESENNIMTYQPSGTITYWRLSTGATIKKVDTLPNLSSIVITHDKRHMLAHHRDRLVVVDLLTGALEASVPLPKMSGLTVSPNDDLVVCMVQREEGIGLESFGFTGSRLYSRSGFPHQQPHSVGRISAIALHEGTWSSATAGETSGSRTRPAS